MAKKGKKKGQEKKSWKEIVTSVTFLKVVFFLLVILVIILGILLYQKDKKEKAAFDSNITIPLYQLDPSFTFGVDVLALSKEKSKDYVIKVTNYKQDYISEEEISYQVLIENLTSAEITLTKDDSKDNLIQEQKKTLLEEVMPSSGEKEETYYHIHLSSLSSKEREFIRVKIIRPDQFEKIEN